jgi:hypothetical protein
MAQAGGADQLGFNRSNKKVCSFGNAVAASLADWTAPEPTIFRRWRLRISISRDVHRP